MRRSKLFRCKARRSAGLMEVPLCESDMTVDEVARHWRWRCRQPKQWQLLSLRSIDSAKSTKNDKDHETSAIMNKGQYEKFLLRTYNFVSSRFTHLSVRCQMSHVCTRRLARYHLDDETILEIFVGITEICQQNKRRH